MIETKSQTLIILRHAKSRWDEPQKTDFERGLAPRGIKAAKRVARWLKRQELLPQFVLCSPAVRTRESLDLIEQEAGLKADVKWLKSLYLAPPSRIQSIINRHLGGHNIMMVIGHNPGLHSFVLKNSGGQTPEPLQANLPTGGIVVFEVPRSGTADSQSFMRLQNFVFPRELTSKGRRRRT